MTDAHVGIFRIEFTRYKTENNADVGKGMERVICIRTSVREIEEKADQIVIFLLFFKCVYSLFTVDVFCLRLFFFSDRVGADEGCSTCSVLYSDVFV